MSLWSLTLLVSGLAPAAYRDSRDNRGTLHIVISISRSEVELSLWFKNCGRSCCCSYNLGSKAGRLYRCYCWGTVDWMTHQEIAMTTVLFIMIFLPALFSLLFFCDAAGPVSTGAVSKRKFVFLSAPRSWELSSTRRDGRYK